jgi:hypothetical protein
MRNARLVAATGILVLLLGAEAGAAAADTPPPQHLQGTYDRWSKVVTLQWTAGGEGPEGSPQPVYRVWRDTELLGKVTGTGYQDLHPTSEQGWVYFVTASLDGGTTWSLPAVAGVSGLSCEVVTMSTSWNFPYVYAHLHQECLGVPFDKDVTWVAQ